MNHQPGVGIPCSTDCVIEIRPALLAVTDDVGAGSNFDTDRHIAISLDRRDNAIRIGVTAVEQLAQTATGQSDT